MKITKVTLNIGYGGNQAIHQSLPQTTFIGMAALRFDDVLTVSHLRVLKKSDGRIVAKMPSVKDSSGNAKQVVYPTSGALESEIQSAILETIASFDLSSNNKVFIKTF